jgi:hypothetical protein
MIAPLEQGDDMDRRASFRNLMTNSLDNQAVAPCLRSSAISVHTTETSTTTTRPDASGPGFALEKNRLS